MSALLETDEGEGHGVGCSHCAYSGTVPTPDGEDSMACPECELCSCEDADAHVPDF
jgi:hypothetical protein